MGYIHGVAVVLIVGQLGKLTGIDVDASDPVPQLVSGSGGPRDIQESGLTGGAASFSPRDFIPAG